jgi:hypothetical protein
LLIRQRQRSEHILMAFLDKTDSHSHIERAQPVRCVQGHRDPRKCVASCQIHLPVYSSNGIPSRTAVPGYESRSRD